MNNRRLFGSACFLMLWTLSVAGQALPSLKDAYRTAFRIGAAVNEEIVSGADSASRQIVIAQFNSITPENEMKAETLNPEPGVWNFGPAIKWLHLRGKYTCFW